MGLGSWVMAEGLVLQKSRWSTAEPRRVHQIRLIGLYDCCNWIELGLKPRIAKKADSNGSIFVDLRAFKDGLFRRPFDSTTYQYIQMETTVTEIMEVTAK